MVLGSSLDRTKVKGMVAQESFASIAEQWSFVAEELTEIKPEHEISVHSLHVVERSDISLHGMVVELEYWFRISVWVLKICA